MAASSASSPCILIAGAGIAGCAAALALTKYFPSPPTIHIYEARPAASASSSALGGAVNLTPNALRLLQHLDVLPCIQSRGQGHPVSSIELYRLDSAAAIGTLDFRGPAGNGFGDPPFKALRIRREHLVDAMRATAAACENIQIFYGQRITGVTESTDSINLTLKNPHNTQTHAHGALLLGTDGIHSPVRTLLVDPARQPTYTGVAVAMAFAPTPSTTSELPLDTTSLFFSRHGSLLLSHHDPARESLFLAAIMSTPEQVSRDGWRARAADVSAIRASIAARFSCDAVPGLQGVLEAAGDWALYPVFALAGGGKWASEGGRAMLLGDAAHAMPPQGESAAVAVEDAVLFARVLGQEVRRAGGGLESEVVRRAGGAYEAKRRPVIDRLYGEATVRWETVKDLGWVEFELKARLTGWFLWWTAAARKTAYEEDVATSKLE